MFGILKCRVEIVQESFFVVADVVQVQVQVERLLCLTTAVAVDTFLLGSSQLAPDLAWSARAR